MSLVVRILSSLEMISGNAPAIDQSICHGPQEATFEPSTTPAISKPDMVRRRLMGHGQAAHVASISPLLPLYFMHLCF